MLAHGVAQSDPRRCNKADESRPPRFSLPNHQFGFHRRLYRGEACDESERESGHLRVGDIAFGGAASFRGGRIRPAHHPRDDIQGGRSLATAPSPETRTTTLRASSNRDGIQGAKGIALGGR